MKKFFRQHIILCIIAFLGVILISLLYSWNEVKYLSFSKRINDQKITNYFLTLFTFIGTIATIFLAYRQQQKSESAQQAAVRPDLIPQQIEIEMIDNGDTVLPSVKSSNFTVCQLKNEGLGKAENITVQWIYDRDKVAKSVKGVYKPINTDLEILEKVKNIAPQGSDFFTLPLFYLSAFGPKSGHNSNLLYMSNYREEVTPGRLQLAVLCEDIYGTKYFKKFEVCVYTNTFNLQDDMIIENIIVYMYFTQTSSIKLDT